MENQGNLTLYSNQKSFWINLCSKKVSQFIYSEKVSKFIFSSKKVSQILCSDLKNPPVGCLQYYTGLTGRVFSSLMIEWTLHSLPQKHQNHNYQYIMQVNCFIIMAFCCWLCSITPWPLVIDRSYDQQYNQFQNAQDAEQYADQHTDQEEEKYAQVRSFNFNGFSTAGTYLHLSDQYYKARWHHSIAIFIIMLLIINENLSSSSLGLHQKRRRLLQDWLGPESWCWLL